MGRNSVLPTADAEAGSKAAPHLALETTGLTQSAAMCGPACLRIIAAYYGRTASEAQISRTCRSSTISGTTGANMVRGARALGLAGRIIDNARFTTTAAWLRKGVPVVVDWMSIGVSRESGERLAEGHYSVVCGLNEDRIILEDPALGGRRRMLRRDFLRVWFDFTHLYPKTKDDLIIRRMIVVAPAEVLAGRTRARAIS